ncbi:MAG: tyrosine-protein phosphatase [Acidimicrobiia bacterium]|nr:tyrosine-protein phosphatase [Acidimicrobiia bacterium]
MTTSVIRLDRVANFRDFGGVLTTDGRRVRPGRLFRSGSLHDMTAADRESLARIGVGVVIDLRCAWERSQLPIEWPGVASVAAPLVTDEVVNEVMRRFRAGLVTSAELEDWWNLVRVYQAPEEHPGSMRVVVDTLLEAKGGVLIHCRGGKDRTGMVAAFVLDALGVGRKAVVADFLASNENARGREARLEIARMLERAGPGHFTDEAMASFAGVRRVWLERLFAGVEERYGSVAGYLAHRVGVGEAAVAVLRQRYVEASHRSG